MVLCFNSLRRSCSRICLWFTYFSSMDSDSIWNVTVQWHDIYFMSWKAGLSKEQDSLPWCLKYNCSHVFSCNSNLKAPGPMKVVVVGSDLYISCVLRPYVDQFSSKPPDFQNHIRFLIIPLGELRVFSISLVYFVFGLIMMLLFHLPSLQFFPHE